MSSLVLERRPVVTLREAHPRGEGFRVLSRIARGQADHVTGYAPRHRRDVPVDLDPRASLAD